LHEVILNIGVTMNIFRFALCAYDYAESVRKNCTGPKLNSMHVMTYLTGSFFKVWFLFLWHV